MMQNLGDSKYSQGSNTEHSNSESIRIPNVLEFGFWMVWFLNVLNVLNHSYERTIRKPNFSISQGRFIYKEKFFTYTSVKTTPILQR